MFESKGYTLLETEYVNNNTPMAYICNEHKNEGVQYITYSNLSRGRGCRYCGIKRRSDKRRLDFSVVENEFKNRGYTLLSTKKDYQTAQSKLRYICPHHPNVVNEISWNNFQRGKGCPLCGSESRGNKTRTPFGEIKKAFEDAGYELVSIDRKHHYEKIKYICPKHRDKGVQEIDWSNFKKGRRCKYCNESKGEKMIAKVLDLLQLAYNKEEAFPNKDKTGYLRFDFYLPNQKVAIEFDGEQHFKPVNFNGISNKEAQKSFEICQNRDAYKNQHCIDNNIKLIRIPYWDIDSIEEILKKELNIY